MSSSNVVVFMPKMGHTTGEMPHLRNPPKNWMPGQNLYYLYTACRNLGYPTKVVDANFARNPVSEILSFEPGKVLISTATPTFDGTLSAIAELRQRGYHREIFVGGPHVSLNHGFRDFLLPELVGVTYIPIINSISTFEWVPRVFPGRSPFEVLGLGSQKQAEDYLRDRWVRETGKQPKANLEHYLFKYFKPSVEWLADTYRGEHVQEKMATVPLRHSIITSIGCSKSCSFCGNPYIYRIGFKSKDVVRDIVRDYKARGIDRISVHDMYFIMALGHAKDMMTVFHEEGMKFSMQTCLENLTEDLLDRLQESGLQKFLVGIENPVSYTVGKKVQLDRVHWLLDQVDERNLAGVKLSYIVGLPGVPLDGDLALLNHIVSEVKARSHPLEDLQVNLYTPYRPESDTRYVPFGAPRKSGRRVVLSLADARAKTIYLLTEIPYRYWGSFPIGLSKPEDLYTQMLLCDVTYSEVYTDFLQPYLALREQYVQEIRDRYPMLVKHIPGFSHSVSRYRTTIDSMNVDAVLAEAVGGSRRHLRGLR